MALSVRQFSMITLPGFLTRAFITCYKHFKFPCIIKNNMCFIRKVDTNKIMKIKERK